MTTKHLRPHSSSNHLTTSVEVWDALVAAGLQEHRSKIRLPGYDQELVRELNRRLFPGSLQPFSRNLSKTPPTVEKFFDAFLPALKPFSMMTRDVLAMFEQAGARRSDHNLKIEFNFDKSLSPEAMTLQHFREQVEKLNWVLRNVTARLWTENTLWGLCREVQQAVPAITRPVTTEEVRHWIDLNGRPRWLDFPGFPHTSDGALDAWLDLSEDLISAMQAELLRTEISYEDPRLPTSPRLDEVDIERPPPESVEGGAGRAFRVVARDFWANSFAQDVCRAVERIRGSGSPEREKLANALSEAMRKGFDAPPQEKRTDVGRVRSQMVHGDQLGKRGIASQIASWCETGFVERLLRTLLDKGFHTYLTADHGNMDAVGMGRINEGATAEMRGARVRVYRSEALAALVPGDIDAFRLGMAGLPADFLPLFAAGRGAFVQKGEPTVAHGGLSIEELVVPFVKVTHGSMGK